MPVDDPIVALDHVQITIPTGMEQQARAFYCEGLGLRELSKPDSLADRGGFWVTVADLQIHIGSEPAWDRNQTKSHIAFRVHDLDYWRSRIVAFGCQINETVSIPCVDRFETRDPFG